MKYKIFALLSALALFTAPVVAEDINLHDELTPQINNEEVEVRAYKHQDGATITEYKSGGKVWMIKVEPGDGFPAYYLYDDEGHGIFKRRELGGREAPTPPMWIIKRF